MSVQDMGLVKGNSMVIADTHIRSYTLANLKALKGTSNTWDGIENIVINNDIICIPVNVTDINKKGYIVLKVTGKTKDKTYSGIVKDIIITTTPETLFRRTVSLEQGQKRSSFTFKHSLGYVPKIYATCKSVHFRSLITVPRYVLIPCTYYADGRNPITINVSADETNVYVEVDRNEELANNNWFQQIEFYIECGGN